MCIRDSFNNQRTYLLSFAVRKFPPLNCHSQIGFIVFFLFFFVYGLFVGFQKFDKRRVNVPKVGIEPTRPKAHEFESCASTSSATSAFVCIDAFAKLIFVLFLPKFNLLNFKNHWIKPSKMYFSGISFIFTCIEGNIFSFKSTFCMDNFFSYSQ